VVNLLVNARQAMPGGGELMVRMAREGNWVALSITDTGIGMPQEKLERCFDEYWSDKKGGTGLGLPTARRIVEEHGGVIEVVSEEGRGTSFTIYLPLLVELAGWARRGQQDAARERSAAELSEDSTAAGTQEGPE
jgi:signal transduction histidine kinase